MRNSLALIAVLSGAAASWAQTTVNFNYTGGVQNWVVPPCVTSVTIVAEGAQGGINGGAGGGLGAVLNFTLPVTPGQTITMDIGGQGACPGAGYNGGGLGYNTTSGPASYSSCGGGGATEISLGGVLVAVAAGGGGAGGGSDNFNGGGGGGCNNGLNGINTYGAGGGGGTQVSGGNGGAPWAGVPPGGQSGSLGQGGNGGFWQTASGGGGGGGYYGGGGGGNDGCCTGANGGGGGGGGSSLIPAGGGCTQASNTGAGTVAITYNSSAPVMTSPNTATICSNGTVNIPLTANMPSTFTWIAVNNPNVTGESTTLQNTSTLNNTLVNLTTVNQVVQYTVTPTASPGGCAGVPQTVNVTVTPGPTMTSTNAATICSGTAVNIGLTANTASTFTWVAADNPNVTGESLVMQNTATLNNTLTNSTGVPQVVTYTVTPTSTPGLCPGTPQMVNVTVNPMPVMIDPADQVLCANTMTNPVFPGCLPGIPGATYSWTNNNTTIGLGAAGVNNIPAFMALNGTIMPVVATVTYTATANGCTSAPVSFTYTVNPIPTVADPANQTICAGSNTTAVIFTGTVPGTTYNWTNDTPSIGLAAAGSGDIAAFTALNAGVTSVTATVTVTPVANGCTGTPQNWTYAVSPNLVAGNDNTATVCNSPGSSIDLNTLLSGNNAVGAWAETSGSGQFNAGTGIFTSAGLAAGTYTFTYTVTGVAPCPNDVANFTVTVTNLPDAGPDNSASLCNGAGTTLDMNTLLSGADAGGTWAETSGAPSGQFNTGTGVLNAAGVPAGTYTFTYTLAAAGPCPGDQAVFTITIEQFVTAGADNNAYVLCNQPGSLFDINTALSGNNVVGTWAETTVPASGQFNPGTGIFDASGLTPGLFSFTYSVTGIAPCLSDVADITLTVEQDADAGLDNAASICNAPGNTLDLNTLLNGNNAPGLWAETTGTPSGQFNATTGVLDAGGLAPGTYTFTMTVVATAPCVNDMADFTITVEQEALAGLDNTASLCNTAGTTLDLNTLLSGNNQPGTWAETTGTPSGQFNAGTGVFNASGLTAGNYTFTYTVAAVAPCLADVANFTVTVQQEAIAGLNNSSTVCNSAGTTLTLNVLLNGNNATGVWAETTGTPSGQFNAGTSVFNAAGLNAGNYTFNYTVSAIAPCVQDIASFTVTVQQEAQAGLDNSAALCNTAGTTLNLNTLLNGNSGPGIWAETTGTPSGQFNAGTGVFTSTGLSAGNYTFTYTVPALAPCVPDVANFTVAVQEAVTAGADGSMARCNAPGNIADLTTLLSGNDPGGFWTETTSSGMFNPGTGVLNVDGLAAGNYSFTYTVNAIAPCVLDVANFTVTVNQVPTINAGADVAVCDGTTITLTATGAGVGGSYVWAGGAVTNGFPFNQPVGTVTYTVTGTDANGCVSTDMVDATVNAMPVVSFVADSLSGCAPLPVNFDNLSVPVGDNCTWNFGNGTTVTGCGTVSTIYENPGNYTVTLTVTTLQGCTSNAVYSNYINVVPFPVADFTFSPQQTDVQDTEIEFQNSSTDAASYLWSFGDETASAMEENPTHLYPVEGNVDYTVELIAYSMFGCTDTMTQIVTIQDQIIFYVPNVFTPDGDDVNNEFLPIFTSGYDIFDYHFAIYNRWGEVLFESYNSTVGWAGTYGEQGLVEDGVYIWRIEFGDNRSDKRHIHNGHVTVLK